MVVADREINDLEVKILDNYKSEDLSDELLNFQTLPDNRGKKLFSY